jgi:muramoyltetrapeptide carboxypeptidase LdcA involved in peptidoglycan recycling
MLTKPARLRSGDKVAAVTLSWGGAGAMLHRYEAGKRQLQDTFNVEVVEMPHTLKDPEWIWRNPRARADDLMQALADLTIRAIISTIGGDDSIRTLPYVDSNIICANPKVFLGYSDTTITHFVCHKAGVASFYGPSIMGGFAENRGMFPYMVQSIHKTLFPSEAIGVIEPNHEGWTAERLDWAEPKNQNRKHQLNPSTGWRFLQGTGVVQGRLIGGCLEVLDWLRGTDFWPESTAWSNAILFLEISEEAPPPIFVTRTLRTLAALGILWQLSGILFGRPGGETPIERFDDYDQALLKVVGEEEGLTNLPVVTRMDFGHTDPMFILPYDALAEIDFERQTFAIVDSAVEQ